MISVIEFKEDVILLFFFSLEINQDFKSFVLSINLDVLFFIME